MQVNLNISINVETDDYNNKTYNLIINDVLVETVVYQVTRDEELHNKLQNYFNHAKIVEALYVLENQLDMKLRSNLINLPTFNKTI